MSVAEPITPPIAARTARHRLATAAGGTAMLAGLALILAGGIPSAVAVAVAAIGILIAVALMLPAGVRALARHPSLLLVAVFLGLAALWLDVGLRHASEVPDGLGAFAPPSGIPYPFVLGHYLEPRILPGTGWPWQIGRLSMLPLVVSLLAAAGGLVLIADAARLRLGITSLTPARRAPWRILTEAPSRQASIGWRMVPGVLLILLAAILAIGLADQYVARPRLPAGDRAHRRPGRRGDPDRQPPAHRIADAAGSRQGGPGPGGGAPALRRPSARLGAPDPRARPATGPRPGGRGPAGPAPGARVARVDGRRIGARLGDPVRRAARDRGRGRGGVPDDGGAHRDRRPAAGQQGRGARRRRARGAAQRRPSRPGRSGLHVLRDRPRACGGLRPRRGPRLRPQRGGQRAARYP